MSKKHLAVYLNDHLAGSEALLEMLVHLQHRAADLRSFLDDLRRDVEADRQRLETLMDLLSIPVNRIRKASGWIVEKFAESKLMLDDPSGGDLSKLESLEAIALGIEGKKALWETLAAVPVEAAGFGVTAYERMLQRAVDQRARVEAVRLQTASSALHAGHQS